MNPTTAIVPQIGQALQPLDNIPRARLALPAIA